MDLGGLKEEIEVSNFFARLGYFTRFHVQLYPKEGKISDIDVLGAKFENHLFPTRNIIETKRSSNSTKAIFQLYGLKNFYKNCNAFFVNNKISYNTFKITNELDIKVYSFDRLKNLSKKDIKYPSIDINEEKGYELIGFIDTIKRDVDNSLFWEYHGLWLENNPFKRLNTIKEMFEVTDEFYGDHKDKKAFLWLRKELFALAFLSILEIASRCIELDNFTINTYIEDQFYNLGTTKDRKLQLKEGLDVVLRIFQEKTGEKIDFKFDIIPEWSNLLIRVVKKIINNANYANKYLLINEQVLKSFIMDRPRNIEIFTDRMTQKVLPSINSDILQILHKEHIFEDFNDYI